MASPSRSLLRHPDFLKLWTAESVSVFGSSITQLAIPLIAAAIPGITPFEFGLLTTIEFLPFIFLRLPAGVWVDRLRRRPILIAADLGRALVLLSIPVAFALNALTIWQLYVVGFLHGCLTVFFDVAYQSYLPSIVERDQLVEGNSKLEITRSASQILGPGAAGLLIGLLKAPFAIILDALSFLWSAGFLFWIRRPEPPIAPHDEAVHGPKPSMRQEIGVGRMLVLTSIGFSLSGLPVAFAPDALIFWGLALFTFLGGYAGVAWNINQVSLRQAITPPRMQGKMNATMRFIVWGTMPVGSVLGAALGSLIGLHP